MNELLAQLNEGERKFLIKRIKLANTWPLVGVFLTTIVLGFTGWLFWKNPLLVNPCVVFGRLKAEAISIRTLKLMAVMLPVITLMYLGLVVFIILMIFEVIRKERIYLIIIRKLTKVKNHDCTVA